MEKNQKRECQEPGMSYSVIIHLLAVGSYTNRLIWGWTGSLENDLNESLSANSLSQKILKTA